MPLPQVREVGFDPQELEKGKRSEPSLQPMLAEMYVQDVLRDNFAAFLIPGSGITHAVRVIPEGYAPFLLR